MVREGSSFSDSFELLYWIAVLVILKNKNCLDKFQDCCRAELLPSNTRIRKRRIKIFFVFACLPPRVREHSLMTSHNFDPKLPPSPLLITLKWVFYLHLHTYCYKIKYPLSLYLGDLIYELPLLTPWGWNELFHWLWPTTKLQAWYGRSGECACSMSEDYDCGILFAGCRQDSLLKIFRLLEIVYSSFSLHRPVETSTISRPSCLDQQLPASIFFFFF